MRIAVLVVRVLMGLMFFVFGLNGFLHFLPQPPAPEAGGAFLGMLVAGNFLPIVSAVEAIAGALLLAGRFVPLALVMLVPVLVGVVVYHLTYDAAGGAPGYVAAALLVFLLWAYRGALMPLLAPRAEPTVGDARLS